MTPGRMPVLTVAPNGARHTHADHPAVPLSVAEIAHTAAACHAAGAQAIHLHVRDGAGRHLLDAGLYAEALAEVARATGGQMAAQVTTEAAGRYAPEDIRAFLSRLSVPRVSIALREVAPDEGHAEAFGRTLEDLAERGVAVQHFLHTPVDLRRFCALVSRGVAPRDGLDLLFVLGRYGAATTDARDLGAYLCVLAEAGLDDVADWSVCAFGREETRALAAALSMGGKARVGFENSFLNADGSRARDNAERVAEVARIGRLLGRLPPA